VFPIHYSLFTIHHPTQSSKLKDSRLLSGQQP
jgi:hypothetical protein